MRFYISVLQGRTCKEAYALIHKPVDIYSKSDSKVDIRLVRRTIVPWV